MLKRSMTRVTLALTAAVFAVQAMGGTIYRSFFDGIPGTTVDSLVDSPVFNRSGGSFAERLNYAFDNVAPDGLNSDDGIDDFGSITRGYIEAPMTGTYTIIVASDDNSELYLNTSENSVDIFSLRDPEYLVGFETGWTNGDLFTAPRLNERSSTVELEKGKKYFVELLHKEGNGGSFIRVGWIRPDGVQQVIPGYMLAPYGSAIDHMTEATAIEIGEQPFGEVVTEGQIARFFVTAFAPQPTSFQWFKNGQPIDGANLSWIEVEAQLSDDGAQYSVEITDGNGAKVTSTSAMLNVLPDDQAPEVLRAVASGRPAGIIVTFSEGVDEASATNPSNYSLSAAGVSITGGQALANDRILLETTGHDGSPMTLTISNVADRSSSANLIAPGTQTPVILQGGLITYHHFDDSGDAFFSQDFTGAYEGSINGPVYVNDGERGSVLSFDGDDDYVNLGQIDELIDVGQFSFSIWFNRTQEVTGATTNHGVDNVLIGHSSTATNDDFEIGTIGSNIDGYLDTQDADANMPTIAATVQDGVWGHLAVTYDRFAANELKIYFDGELVFEANNYGGLTDGVTGTEWTLGLARPDGNLWGEFNGLMDDFAAFDFPLSPEMIAALASNEANPSTIWAAVGGQIAIIEQPQDVSTLELVDTSFSVSIEGTDPTIARYQWYRDGAPLNGETGPVLNIIQPDETDNGAVFHVEVYNANGAFSTVVSEEATLTVISDFDAPELVSIEGFSGGLNFIRLTFNESLEAATVTDAGNYSIAGLTVNSAEVGVADNVVILRTSAIADETEYSVAVQNVTDLVGNAIDQDFNFISQNSYTEQILFDNPVRYWTMDDLTGTVALNTATFGLNGMDLRNGTYINSPNLNVEGLVPSKVGATALELDPAQSQKMTAGITSDLNSSVGPWRTKSFEFWFRADRMPDLGSTGLTAARGLYEQGGGDRAIGLYLWRGPNDTEADTAQLVFYGFNRLADAGGVASPWFDPSIETAGHYVSTEVSVGNVYHVVGVMDGSDNSDGFGPPYSGTLELFVNGESVDQVSGVGLLYNHTGDVQLGQGNMRIHDNSNGALAYFDGVIDEFAAYNTALSAERIQQHFESAFAGVVEFGDAQITQQPVPQTVLEGEIAEFRVEFSGTPPITVAWTVNGQPVNGATAETESILTFPVAGSDDGSVIQVTVSNDTGSETSNEVTLSVTLETTPPTIVSAVATGGDLNTITVEFSEALEQASAEDAANYTVDGLSISGAILLPDQKTVVLTTDQQQLGSSYTLNVSGVKDASVTGNVIADGASVSMNSEFTYSDAVLADEPDGYWKLGEGTGNIGALNTANPLWTASYAATGASGTLAELEVERLVVGSKDPAARFDAFEENRVEILDSAAMNTGGPYQFRTIELWFNAASAPRSNEKMVLFEEGGLTRGTCIYLSENGTTDSADLYFFAWNDNADGAGSPWSGPLSEGKTPLYVSTTVNVGETYHIAYVMSGDPDDDGDLVFNGTITGYVNGASVGEVSGIGLLYAHGDDGAIGGTWTNAVFHDDNFGVASGAYFDGVIDEVALYNAPLSAERIQFHYETGTTEVPFVGPTVPAVGGELGEITSISLADGQITITWEGNGELAGSADVNGSFSTIDGAVSPYTVEATEATQFFRLQ